MLKKLSTLVLITVFGFQSYAELPTIENKKDSHEPSTLPAVIKPSDRSAFIDMDDDGDVDFFVWLDMNTSGSSGSSGYSEFYIQHNSSSDGVDGAFLSPLPADDFAIVIGSGFGSLEDLKTHGFAPERYVSNLEAGTEIGPVPPFETQWTRYEQLIMTEEEGYHVSPFFNRPPEETDETKKDVQTEIEHVGYIGLRYAKGAGSQYGWLQVEVNSNDNSVTILGKGIAPDVNEPVIAGDAPLAPLSFIATFLGLGIIGLGAARRKRRKQ